MRTTQGSSHLSSSIRIFVVEDEAMVREVLDHGLTDVGYDVVMACSAEDAMSALDDEASSYAVMITDIELHGPLTGWDVAKHARSINCGLPVLYMTSEGGRRDFILKSVPNSGLLIKPFEISSLTAAVSQLLSAV
jgi:DNA-binding response OmpR family regulator